MSTKIVVPVDGTNGFINGAVVSAWLVSRFGYATVPVQGTAAPGGSPDNVEGYVTTATGGAPGQAVLTLPTSTVSYNILTTYSGVNYWTQAPGIDQASLTLTESQVTGLTTDLAAKVVSVAAGDATVTVGGTATAPTVKVTGGTFDASGAASSAQSTAISTAASDATTKANAAQAAAIAASVSKAGDTMGGALAMGAHKITGLTNGSASDDAAAFGQIKASLIGIVQYAPASLATFTNSTTTLAAMDTTNLTVSFVAPASGKVLVRLTALVRASGTNADWGLLDHTTHAQVGSNVYMTGSTTVFNLPGIFYITGLTPGATYQYDWALASANATAAITYAQGKTGTVGSEAGPATMEVWAA